MKTIIWGYSVFLILIGSVAFTSGWDTVDAWFFAVTAICAVAGIFVAYKQCRLRRTLATSSQEVRR